MINMQSDGLFYRLLVTPRRPSKFQSMTLPFFLAQPRSKLISMARWCGSGRKITKQTMASAECTTSHICQGYRGDIVTSCNFMINAKSYRHNIYETIPCSCSCRSQEQVQFCGVSPHVGYFCGSMNIKFFRHWYSPFFHINFWMNIFFCGSMNIDSPGIHHGFCTLLPKKISESSPPWGANRHGSDSAWSPGSGRRRPKARPVRCAVNRHMIYIYICMYVCNVM